MKIVVNGRFSDRKTGVGRVIENLLIYLQRIDNRNEYFIYVNKEFEHFLENRSPTFHIISNGIPAGNMLLNHLWTQTGFIYAILKHRADVVLLPQINLYIFKLAPTILFQHDLIEYYVTNQRWYKMLFRRIAYPLAIKLSDRIIGVSENTVRDIKKFFNVPDSKLDLIYNGADDSFKPLDRKHSKKYISDRYGINDNFILYVGTLTLPQKNLLRLVEAYEKVIKKGIDVKLVMVGRRWKDCEKIFDLVAGKGLQNSVIFTEYAPDEDLPYFYNSAEVFCFPSIYEGFGLPVLEAMACGCPVVTSNVSSLPEVVGDAGIMIDPYSVEELSGALLKMLTDEKARERYIAAGLEQCKKFSWEESAKKLLQIIQSLRRGK